MGMKPKLRELIYRAKDGDEEALVQLVERFVPIVKKYTRRVGNGEMYSNLVEWIVKAVKRYQPDTRWGREELNRYLASLREKNDIKKQE
ncbi:helix-turn-helix domain-containing protein [Thermosediminibacter oceani]|uniref:Helix-turn-helix conjugative transposon-like domain-containing protein n=1 Tax=Thermosediminibacter oceani (strain ATCC BAA-1034 / DSM 16646 / JW/IW-1228P) TaxID=555079 RepID=D9RYQ8_THEOJ|nr:helix-turn-helix domain-containing protein [Thermosediminibacter oceani]ADL08482.1 hypothetical protein Toce_1748 [Thermosediminibacter oceani DSM 16646]